MRIFPFAAIALLLIVGSSGQLRAQAPQGKTITVADAWSRATPKGSTTAVIYMTLINSGQNADRLLGAATPIAAVCFSVWVEALTRIGLAPDTASVGSQT